MGIPFSNTIGVPDANADDKKQILLMPNTVQSYVRISMGDTMGKLSHTTPTPVYTIPIANTIAMGVGLNHGIFQQTTDETP